MKRYIVTASVAALSMLAVFAAGGHTAHASTLFQPPNNNGLLAWWPLDEGNGTVAHDLSGNGYTGTLNNFTTTSSVDSPTWTTGQFGNAVSFNASNGQYVVASSSGAFNYSQSWTISAWVNLTTATLQFPVSLIVGTTSPAWIQFLRLRATGQFDTILYSTNSSGAVTSTTYIASSTMATGAWHNLMMVWDSSANTLTFYLDGVSAGTTPVVLAPGSFPVREFVLGARGLDFQTDLNGSLDDVRLYQRALSASEAANIYSGATVSSSNLIGWWKFDEGSGYSTVDSSGNGQTAYLSQEGWVSGKKGRALAFRGTDSAARSITTNLTNATGDGTIAVWFKAHGQFSDTSRTEHLIVGAGSPTDGMSTSVAWIYLKSPWAENPPSGGIGPGGTLAFLWGCPNCGNGVYRTNTTKTYDDNQWHFAVMTQSGGTMTAYVDGALVGTNSASTTIDNTYPYYIGSVKTDSSAWNFGGAIDDVRVYNRALSATEVKTLYSAGQVTRKTVSGSGLAGWWKFDEGTSTIAHDFSGNGNTGTLTNMNDAVNNGWIPGKKGGAVTLDGSDDYVDAGNASSVNVTSAMTISAWAYYSDLSKTTIASKWGNVSHSGYSWLLFDNWFSNGQVNLLLSTNGTTYTNISSPANAIAAGQWYHIVGTYDGSTANLYINGALAGTASVSGSLHVSSTNLTIGADWDTGSVDTLFRNFKGKLDDVRLYSRALSATEVLALYKENSTRIGHSQENVLNGGLVGYWSFNGPDIHWNNNTAIDHSPQNNNGTLTNMSQSTSPVGGRVGQALSFEGSSPYISVPWPFKTDITSAVNAGNVSFCTWMKADSLPSSGGEYGIMGVGSSASGGLNLMLYYTGAVKYWYSGLGGAIFSSTVLSTGKWYHICGTSSPTSISIYVNGRLDGTASNNMTGFSLVPVGNLFAIGNEGQLQSGRYFAGALDEVRVYNRSLSATEVNELYRLGK